MRRVLFVDHASRILGGAEVNLLELLAEPAAKEHWSVTCACHPSGPLHAALAASKVECRSYGLTDDLGTLRLVGRRFPISSILKSLGSLRQARAALAGIVAETRPEVVISCTNKDHLAATPVCRRSGKASVWWVNDIISPDFFPWSARQALRWHARNGARGLVTVSDYARAAVVSEGIPPARVRTIHNGIPPDRYRRRERGAVRCRIGVNEQEPLVGIIGRFTPWKGQDFFLRLASAWCARGERGHFVLVGHAFNEDQPFEARLRQGVVEQGLEARIHFLPFQQDIAATLSDLDVLVHASIKPEPFGRVLIEAMAVGVPLLAARAGGVPEIVRDGCDGLLATPGNLDDYRHQLSRLLGDPSLREALVTAGRARLAERFTVARVWRQFDELFAEVA